VESSVALALKTLCGFSVSEIARGLLTTDANVAKRISRAKEALREHPREQTFSPDFASRMESVRRVLYLLFNEGYYSSSDNCIVRQELCDEATRLAHILVDNPAGAQPATHALIALMYFHSARFAGRADAWGRMVLLEDQDRTQWDRERIQQGWRWLGRAAQGDELSRYHIEAGIAAEHCQAPHFVDTNWPRIVQLYDLLCAREPGDVHHLNRAIALAYAHGTEAGLASLASLRPERMAGAQHLLEATLAELHFRAGHLQKADQHYQAALALAPTAGERELLHRRAARVR
jgi:RNA polymerase sigma-70 factor (ECF subfamily)